MKLETIILVIAWIITAAALIIFVPKNKIREAILIFFFIQLITWFIGLLVVELGLIVYPVRSFAIATQSSFDFEYFIYPAICVIFNLHYPEGKTVMRQFIHYISFCSAVTIVEVIVESCTDIITYVHWDWYVTWITLLVTFFASRKFYVWFFKLNKTSE